MPRRRRDDAPAISLFSFQDIMAAVTGIMILVTLLLALEPLAEEMLQPSRRRTAPTDPAPSTSIEDATALVQRLEADVSRRLASPAVDEAEVARLEAEADSQQRLADGVRERRDRALAAKSRAESQLAGAERLEAEARESLESTLARWRRAQMQARVRFLPGERFPRSPLFIEVGGAGLSLGEFDAEGVVSQIGRSADGAWPSIASLLGDRTPEAWQAVFVVRQDGLDRFESLRGAFHERGWEVGWQLWDAREGGFFDAPTLEGAPP
ncbi:MAG: hypothetical protein FJ253_00455 [Phycisphaerae bacterium]|nr:hypothetical protein [Phycisphaerae bacterium]